MTQRREAWLDQLSSRACITDVARVAIPRRLETVFAYVPLVTHHANRSDEYVHQLRVATRRAQTAIALCAPVLPAKQTKAWKQILRGFRGAAGAVRDFDVMLQMLDTLPPDQLFTVAERDEMVRWLRTQRAVELASSLKQIRKLARGDQCRRWRRLVSQVRWTGHQPEPAARDVFETRLRKLSQDFFRLSIAVMQLEHVEADVPSLHALRISAKRLRYTIEAVSGVFDDRLNESCKFIKLVQTNLGRVHDHANASTFLRQAEPTGPFADLRPVLCRLASHESEAMQAGLDEWSAWWTASRLEQFWKEWHEVVGGNHWSSRQPA